MAEVTKRIYIGSNTNGRKRKRNLEKLAEKHFRGNVSRLYNDAVDRVYGLDRDTGDPVPGSYLDTSTNPLLNDSHPKKRTRF